MVWVYLKTPKDFLPETPRTNRRMFRANPTNKVFITNHTWDHGVEHGFNKRREDALQEELAYILKHGKVSNHGAITKYISLWRARAEIAHQPSEPVELVGVTPDNFSQEQQDRLEKSGLAYSGKDGLPPHFAGSMRLRLLTDSLCSQLEGVRWVVTTLPADGGEFVVPDRPDAAWLPITPKMMLVPGRSDGPALDALRGSPQTPHEANVESVLAANKFVFARSREAIEEALDAAQRWRSGQS